VLKISEGKFAGKEDRLSEIIFPKNWVEKILELLDNFPVKNTLL
jgi:hypothetical protein